jgi:hypothetical protein
MMDPASTVRSPRLERTEPVRTGSLTAVAR